MSFKIIKTSNVKRIDFEKVSIEATGNEFHPVSICFRTSSHNANYEYKVWQTLPAEKFLEFVEALNELAKYVEEKA